MANKKKHSEQRAGKRRDRNSNYETREPLLAYYLIVTDAEKTERSYFEGLRDSIPKELQRRVVVHVEKAKTTYALLNKVEELCDATAQQRIPWIVFDRDQVKEFDDMIRKAEEKDIHAGWSNPCFEIWMFAYFGTMPSIDNSVSCIDKFKERWKNFTGHEYQKNDTGIFRKLNEKGDYEKAYKLAEQNLLRSIKDGKSPSEAYPVCTVHHLVKEITDRIQ